MTQGQARKVLDAFFSPLKLLDCLAVKWGIYKRWVGWNWKFIG